MSVLPLPRRQAPARHRSIHDQAADSMHLWFEHIRRKGETDTLSPEEFYGFRAEDVAEIYFRRRDLGHGFWYRLNDGRVFDGHGRPSDSDYSRYVSG